MRQRHGGERSACRDALRKLRDAINNEVRDREADERIALLGRLEAEYGIGRFA